MRESSMHRRTGWVLALAAGLMAVGTAHGQLTVSQYPSLVTAPPPPNVILTLDDSGSMSSAFLPDSIGPQNATAGFASSAYNGAYYNPLVTYPVPPDAAGNPVPTGQGYPPVKWPIAYYDGFLPQLANDETGSNTLDLSSRYQATRRMTYPRNVQGTLRVMPVPVPNPTGTGAAYYYNYPNPPLDGCPPAVNGVLPTTGAPPSDNCFQLVTVSANSGPGGSDERQNFANWFSFYRTRHLAIVSAGAQAMQGQNLENMRVAWQALNSCDDFSGNDCVGAITGTSYNNKISQFANGHRTDFYNWLFELPAANTTPTRYAWWRAGQYYSDPTLGADGPYGVNPNPSLSAAAGSSRKPYSSSTTELLCVNNFNITLTDGLWNVAGEPRPQNFCGSGPCPNADNGAVVTFPDNTNYDVTSNPLTALYSDGSGGGDSAISGGGLADIAFYYWSTNLRPDLTGFYTPPYVPSPNPGTSGPTASALWPYWNPQNDPATWPHMVNFTVGVGLTSFLSMPGLPWINDALNVNGNSLGNPLGNILTGALNCYPPSVAASLSAPPPPPQPGSGAPCTWPQVITNASGDLGFTGTYAGAGNVYDLWHAAINSRGDAFSASTPQDIVNAMGAIFTRIEGQTIGSSAPAGSSTSVSVGTNGATQQIFIASYNGSDWHGTVSAYAVDPTTGDVNTSAPTWQTSAASIPSPAVRANSVFTANQALPADGSGQSASPGIPFSPGASPTSLGAQPSTCQPANTGAAGPGSLIGLYGSYFGDVVHGGNNDQNLVVCYLLGDTSSEAQNGGLMRNRHVAAAGSPAEIVLGDIVDSAPLYSWQDNFNDGGLPAAQGGPTYTDFVIAKSSRLPVVYAGANDGMLHAFDATTSGAPPNGTSGNEVFAYVPHAVIPNLGNATSTNVANSPNLSGLVSPAYVHSFSVDGPVTVRDAYFTSNTPCPAGSGAPVPAWHSVLVGTTGAGGPGVYALDVTNPGRFGAGCVLWDMDGSAFGSNDPNLGDTIGQATIVLLNNGYWAAIFGNGYSSPRSCAVLYVVRLDNGALLRTIDTSGVAAGSSCGNNGLGSPTPVDVNNDGTTDVVYAGDLQGNLWKFDLSSTDATQWSVAYKDAGGNSLPLFNAMVASGGNLVPQPIVAAPNVAATGVNSLGANTYLVYFVTGHMFATQDSSDTTTQSLYAVADSALPITTALTRGNLTQQSLSMSATGNLDIATPYPAVGPSGWFLDFNGTGTNTGERALSQPFLGDGMVIVSTVIPMTQPCNGGCGGFIYAINQVNGDGGMNYLMSNGVSYDALQTSVGCIKGLLFLNNGTSMNWYAVGNNYSGNGTGGGTGSGGPGSGPGNTGAPLSGVGSGPPVQSGSGKVQAPGRISWHEVAPQ